MCPALGPLPYDQLVSVAASRPLEGSLTAVDDLVYLDHCVGTDRDISGEVEDQGDWQRDRVVRCHWLELTGLQTGGSK